MTAIDRLRSLPPDATATQTLCAAIGCDRKHLPTSSVGGAPAALADAIRDCVDLPSLLGLAVELDGASYEFRSAASDMPKGDVRDAVVSFAEDYSEIASRIRRAIRDIRTPL